MLSTGIRTPLGIKITGPDSKGISELAQEIETVLRKIKGTRSIFAERIEGGHYLDIHDGPTEIKSENGRLVGYVYINTENRDLGGYVEEAKEQIEKSVNAKPGYAIAWSGQYANLEHARARLYWLIPITLLLVC